MGSTVRQLPQGRTKWLLAVGFCLAVGAGVAADHRWAPTTEDESVEGGPVDSFRSRPDLRPPTLTVETAQASPRPGHIFVAPWRGEGQDGTMILDDRGELVWFDPQPEEQQAMDFRVQEYRGRPVLTWWEGEFGPGYGFGDYVIADASYREIARFPAGNGVPGDFHEFLVTPRGTALVTIYRLVGEDLSALGGSEHGKVLEGVVQEIDIDTGRVLLNWRSLDHVDLAESHESAPTEPGEVFDYFHVNAIDIDRDGNLLVSARHTDTVYKLDRRTGAVIWRLGGRRSDFRLGPGARFFSQHDARRQPDGSITIFDNGAPPEQHESSRGIALRLDRASMTANLERQVEHPLGLLSESQGNAQTLPGGDVVIGWGSQPYLSRLDERGELVFDAHFPEETDVYRAYQAEWTGRPDTRPAIDAVVEGSGELSVHASWNGATEVAAWQVLTGPRPGALRPTASSAWEGFETAITARSGEPYVAVRALDASDNVLGRSPTVRVGG